MIEIPHPHPQDQETTVADPSYTPDPADYELVWKTIHDGLGNPRCLHGTQDPELCIGCATDAVLAALAAKGRLRDEQRCENCAPGYDCERGIYTPTTEES